MLWLNATMKKIITEAINSGEDWHEKFCNDEFIRKMQRDYMKVVQRNIEEQLTQQEMGEALAGEIAKSTYMLFMSNILKSVMLHAVKGEPWESAFDEVDKKMRQPFKPSDKEEA